ncbi:MAG: UDP-N-acetylmuramate dehydrogenase [Spirochaetota bacterium]
MPTLVKFLSKINIEASIALDEPLSSHTSFRIGGPADAFVAPPGEAELLGLVAEARAEGIPLFFLGGGANLLVGDGGIRGIVVELRHLASARIEAAASRPMEEGFQLVAEAGARLSGLCEFALAQGLSGLENFYAMPGSLGGSLFMNARCYEIEMADIIESVTILDPRGEIRNLTVRREDWSYKRSPFQSGESEAGALILGARLRLREASRADIGATMRMRFADREAKGHFRLPSAGSVFKNDRSLGKPSGAILDALGMRGTRIGDALVSPWHANIFVNAGRATARDMLCLIDLAKSRVFKELGVELEPEVRLVGEP